MKSIQFSEQFVDFNGRDLQNFIVDLIDNSKFDDADIQVLTYSRRDDGAMSNIAIELNAYDQDDIVRWEWMCYRAKDFTSQNRCFSKKTA